jgi:hypothetical protein
VTGEAIQTQTEAQRQAKHTILDIGEGWGSIRRATQSMEDLSIETIGVDRRGMTNTGAKHGVITAAVNHDLTDRGAHGVMESIAKKAGRATSKWTMAWLSPECSPFSIANAINQPTGTAHGFYAATDKNKTNTTAQGLMEEDAYLQEAMTSLRNIIEGLETSEVLFALENPATSAMWELRMVKEAIKRNAPHWRVVQVDQCAYGRRSQKLTRILTNIKDWTPTGITGNGRCITGKCTGTASNARGDRRHLEQTVPNSKERRPSQGNRTRGRWDFTREAVVNAVEAKLVQEIIRAAILEKETQEKNKEAR